jgi:methyl-accepting chemotaxis protein
VSDNISGIAGAAATTSAAAAALRQASDVLRHEATTLDQEIVGFFENMRAA